ncbi:MAG: hypothetical protein WDZ61_00260 [Parcubacteria group bacterium]
MFDFIITIWLILILVSISLAVGIRAFTHLMNAPVMYEFKAPRGMFRLFGESPMDDDEYFEGDFRSLNIAKGAASVFVARGPRFLTASVYDDTGTKVFELGTL